MALFSVIYQNGVEIPVVGWSVSESVWSYCAEVTVTIMGPSLTSAIWYLDADQQMGFFAVRQTRSSSTETTYVSWPLAYYQLCSSMSSPTNLVGTIQDVCVNLALPFRSLHDAANLIPLRWVLGSLRGRRLFDVLVQGAACTDGGCSTMFYNVSGNLQYADLVALRSFGPLFSFAGKMEPMSDSIESGVVDPGAVDFIFDDESGLGSAVREVFDESSFVGGYHSYLASSELRSRRVWQYRNRFWRSFIRSRVCKFSGVTLSDGSLLCGVPCMYMGDAASLYICTGYTNRMSGGISDVTLECYRL